MGSHNNALDLRDSFRGPDLHLFFRDLRDRHAKKRSFTVKSWSTVKDVKDAIGSILNVPPGAVLLYYGPLAALPNHRSLHDAGIYRSGETLLLDIRTGYAGSTPSLSPSASSSRGTPGLQHRFDVSVCSSMLGITPKHLRFVVQQARRGLALGVKPELVIDGSGGTYYLHDAKKVRIAVFKPADEEPFAENNPRGYVPQPTGTGSTALREGIDPGEACLREVAAYLLDHGGFSSVPMTTLTEARHPAFNTNAALLSSTQGTAATVGSHVFLQDGSSSVNNTKVGSFQVFAKSECTMDDISPSKLSKDEVHKIAILDIRLMNADRNAANLLCQRRPDNTLKLIPIDHGFCLRSVCDVSWMDWCWLDWPQMKEPLSRRSKEYILKLNIDADARLLKETLNIQGAAIDYFRASSKVLQEGVKAGLTLYQIAVLCCRNDNMGEIPSNLEGMNDIAKELSIVAADNGRWHHATASKAIADQLSPFAIKTNHHQSSESVSPFTSESRFVKSASTENVSSLAFIEKGQDMPSMVQSSASDGSSDVGDVAMEREECEEWAAGIIADISTDRRQSVPAERRDTHTPIPPPTGDNAVEADSDSRLSSSPTGFWMTKPGDNDFDDKSITWSPASSPIALVDVPANIGMSIGMAIGAGAGTYADRQRILPNTPQPRTSVDSTPFLLPPATIDISSVKKDHHHQLFMQQESSLPNNKTRTPQSNVCGKKAAAAIPPFLRKMGVSEGGGGRMSRSQSYCSFRSASNASGSANNRLLSNKGQNQTYFLKFLDLVIAREISVAARTADDGRR